MHLYHMKCHYLKTTCETIFQVFLIPVVTSCAFCVISAVFTVLRASRQILSTLINPSVYLIHLIALVLLF